MTAPKPEPGQVLEQATEAVNKKLGGKLWQHVKTGGVYLEYGRGDHVFDKKAGDRVFSGIMGAPLIDVTDDIAAGEEFVRYRNVLTGEGWARPARLFDDGRFVPLVLANPAILRQQAAQLAEAEAREQELKALQDFLIDEGMAYRCESCQRFLKEEDALFDCYDVPLCQEHYDALEGATHDQ